MSVWAGRMHFFIKFLECIYRCLCHGMVLPDIQVLQIGKCPTGQKEGTLTR